MGSVFLAALMSSLLSGPRQDLADAGPGLVPGSSPGMASTEYRYDTDKSIPLFGLTGGGELVWLHRFDTSDFGLGVDTITGLGVAWGSPSHPGNAPPNGTPASAYVWDDADEDGDPRTGLVFLNETATTVQNVDTDVINRIDLSAPTVVTGVFFVGASLSHGPGEGGAPADGNGDIGTGKAWITGNTSPGGFDPNDLQGPGSIGVFDMLAIGYPVVWLLRGEGAGFECSLATYCTAKTNSCGALPAIEAAGIPSASATSGFGVSTTGVRAGRHGLLLYTDGGSASLPFEGGLLCVGAPVRRTVPIQDADGTPQMCDGSLDIDLLEFANGALGGNPASFLLVPGTQVNSQWWARDTQASGSLLSDGIQFVVCP